MHSYLPCAPLLLLVVAGCGWFDDGGAANISSDDPTAGAAATVDTGADPLLADDASDDGAFVHTTIRQRSRNPQRELADPYYIIGQTLPEWDVEKWVNDEALMLDPPLTLEKLRGRVVVVRFWTDESEACARTMPALEQLAQEFRSQPVKFVGIYYTPRTFGDQWPKALARVQQWNLTFPIAEDTSTHSRWWLSRYDNLPTTPTLVIGPEGRVVHMHPGPDLFPTDDPAEKICDDDFHALRAAINKALERQLAEIRPER